MGLTRGRGVTRDATWWTIEVVSALVSGWLASAEALSTPSQRPRVRRARDRWREIRREHRDRLARIEASSPTELPHLVEALLSHPDLHSTPLAAEVRSNLRRQDEEADNLMALTAAAQEDAGTAADALRAYLAEHPESTLARARLAQNLERMGNLAGSIEVYRESRTLEAAPYLRTLSSVQIGRLLALQGEHAEAVAELRGVLAASDSKVKFLRPLAHLYLGVALNAQGDIHAARSAWKQAARLDQCGAIRGEARRLIAESVRPQ